MLIHVNAFIQNATIYNCPSFLSLPNNIFTFSNVLKIPEGLGKQPLLFSSRYANAVIL